MKFSDEGLHLNRAELDALIAFSSDEPASNFCGVKVITTGKHVVARATNGAIALNARGTNHTAKENEWFILRDFLRAVFKALQPDHTAVIDFHGASLRDAKLRDKDGLDVATFSWEKDAALLQWSFPSEREFLALLTVPKGKQVRSVTLHRDYLALMSKVGKAADQAGIECFAPENEDERMVFAVDGHDTEFRALVMPMAGREPEEMPPVEETPIEARARRAGDASKAADAFLDAVDGIKSNPGGSVTMTTPDGKVTDITKGRKPGAKKASELKKKSKAKK